MKKRFKFDESWRVALSLIGDFSGLIDKEIYRYMEEGTPPMVGDLNYYFEGFHIVWGLIKAQIDERQARNARARERRRMRREAKEKAIADAIRRKEEAEERRRLAREAEEARIIAERKARKREALLRRVAARRDTVQTIKRKPTGKSMTGSASTCQTGTANPCRTGSVSQSQTDTVRMSLPDSVSPCRADTAKKKAGRPCLPDSPQDINRTDESVSGTDYSIT